MTTLIKSAIKRIPGAKRLKGPMYSSLLTALRLVHGGDAYRKVIFKRIWADNHWGDPESQSGSGSTLRETEHLRGDLAALLENLHVRDLLDLPCGDFHWMKEVSLPPSLNYVGGDIVDQIVEKNQSRFGDERRQFRTIDILRDPLPPSDLILCRDCLVHFSFSDIFSAMANVKRSSAKYLLTTHYTDDRTNADIATGLWRPLNLTQSPLNFPPPLLLIDEQSSEDNVQDRGKCLGLWRLRDLSEYES